VVSGERKPLLSVDISGLGQAQALLVAQLGELGAWSLTCEPKALQLGAPAPLELTLGAERGLRLKTPGPVVDLWLSDATGARPFADNLITLPGAGTLELRYDGDGRELRARSLAGEHPLRLARA
jgi:hypothetical protein